MSTSTIEERMAALEAKVEKIQQRAETKGEEPRGWQRVFGRFADMPGFDEAVRLGREWRESQGPPHEEDNI